MIKIITISGILLLFMHCNSSSEKNLRVNITDQTFSLDNTEYCIKEILIARKSNQDTFFSFSVPKTDKCLQHIEMRKLDNDQYNVIGMFPTLSNNEEKVYYLQVQAVRLDSTTNKKVGYVINYREIFDLEKDTILEISPTTRH